MTYHFHTTLTRRKRIIIIISFSLLCLFIVAKSLTLSRTYGGTDLRARVVGARAMQIGKSPYFYKWKPSDGDRLLDPNANPQRQANGNVATPAVLLLMQPLISLPYSYIRTIWTALELLAIASIFFFITHSTQNYTLRILWVLPVMLILIASPYFALHIDRGQMYLFYQATIAISYYLYTKNASRKILSGCLVGLLVFFRPFALFFPLPFLLKREWKWLTGFATGLFGGLAIFVLPAYDTWLEYFHAMLFYSLETTSAHDLHTYSPHHNPTVIEGCENLSKWGQYTITCLRNMNAIAPKINLELTESLAFLISFIVFALLTILFHISSPRNTEQLFVLGVVLMILCEYFSKAPRTPYNVLQWTIPLVFITRYFTKYKQYAGLIMGLLLFAIFHSILQFFYGKGYLGEAIVLITSIWYTLKPAKENPAPLSN